MTDSSDFEYGDLFSLDKLDFDDDDFLMGSSEEDGGSSDEQFLDNMFVDESKLPDHQLGFDVDFLNEEKEKSPTAEPPRIQSPPKPPRPVIEKPTKPKLEPENDEERSVFEQIENDYPTTIEQKKLLWRKRNNPRTRNDAAYRFNDFQVYATKRTPTWTENEILFWLNTVRAQRESHKRTGKKPKKNYGTRSIGLKYKNGVQLQKFETSFVKQKPKREYQKYLAEFNKIMGNDSPSEEEKTTQVQPPPPPKKKTKPIFRKRVPPVIIPDNTIIQSTIQIGEQRKCKYCKNMSRRNCTLCIGTTSAVCESCFNDCGISGCKKRSCPDCVATACEGCYEEKKLLFCSDHIHDCQYCSDLWCSRCFGKHEKAEKKLFNQLMKKKEKKKKRKKRKRDQKKSNELLDKDGIAQPSKKKRKT